MDEGEAWCRPPAGAAAAASPTVPACITACCHTFALRTHLFRRAPLELRVPCDKRKARGSTKRSDLRPLLLNDVPKIQIAIGSNAGHSIVAAAAALAAPLPLTTTRSLVSLAPRVLLCRLQTIPALKHAV